MKGACPDTTGPSNTVTAPQPAPHPRVELGGTGGLDLRAPGCFRPIGHPGGRWRAGFLEEVMSEPLEIRQGLPWPREVGIPGRAREAAEGKGLRLQIQVRVAVTIPKP